ncbi:hypothetical protein GUJ93_ZPchr0001g29397 [Zizania palustris]|uniref:Uncharacterized protein n=1 Tax=Zizania palustris TaxID=103762 RepID=A0A8J5V058_ZIZPA|nr:hypothetical protein GUJ93_ZPchr0001g29397 [Zizania palustris]
MASTMRSLECSSQYLFCIFLSSQYHGLDDEVPEVLKDNQEFQHKITDLSSKIPEKTKDQLTDQTLDTRKNTSSS